MGSWGKQDIIAPRWLTFRRGRRTDRLSTSRVRHGFRPVSPRVDEVSAGSHDEIGRISRFEPPASPSDSIPRSWRSIELELGDTVERIQEAAKAYAHAEAYAAHMERQAEELLAAAGQELRSLAEKLEQAEQRTRDADARTAAAEERELQALRWIEQLNKALVEAFSPMRATAAD